MLANYCFPFEAVLSITGMAVSNFGIFLKGCLDRRAVEAPELDSATVSSRRSRPGVDAKVIRRHPLLSRLHTMGMREVGETRLWLLGPQDINSGIRRTTSGITDLRRKMEVPRLRCWVWTVQPLEDVITVGVFVFFGCFIGRRAV